MGALHEGHRALIRRAVREPSPTLVYIFVNPAQFNDPRDYEAYTVNLDADLELCRADGADAVFAPSVDDVYPPDDPPFIPPLPDVARLPGLEDAARPGHFEGVCRVLHRFFTLIRPAAAVFGEKDWQQLQVTRALVRQEQLGVDIIAAPTVRDHDGLALSSRNTRLDPAARAKALAIPLALDAAARAKTPAAAEIAMLDSLQGVDVAYAVVRDAVTLLAPGPSGPYRALIAGAVGGVHLLDNADWPAGLVKATP